MASYLVHVWSGHFDFLLLFVDFSWPILKHSSGGLHSSSRSSNATLPAGAEASCSQPASPGEAALHRAVVCTVLQLERERHLCLVLGPRQLSSRVGSAFKPAQRGLAGPVFPDTHGLSCPAGPCSRTGGSRVLLDPRSIPPFGRCE